MRLTILGSSASYAGPGQACSGYLVETAGSTVMFESGNGSFANLLRLIDPSTLDAVFITHCHPDHFADLYALQSYLRYSPSGPRSPLSLYAPAGLLSRMEGLLSGQGASELRDSFVSHDLSNGLEVEFGDLTVRALVVQHMDQTFGLRATEGDRALAYSADTKPGPWLQGLFGEADLVLCEATLPEPYRDRAPHLTATQAGTAARDARARRLVLTHIWPTNDRKAAAAEAASAFGDEVAVATEFATFDL